MGSMVNGLISTSAGPLCVTHLDFWIPQIEHTATETLIRLSTRYQVAPGVPRAAMVVVSVVNRNESLESLVQDANLHLQTQPGLEETYIDFVSENSGNRWGQIHYRLKVAPEDPKSDEMLFGLVVIRKIQDQAVRFDYIAEERFFKAHYRETLIMSRTVELVN